MKLLIFSLLASGAISAAVGEAGLKVKRSTACNCELYFGADRVFTNGIATSPGRITTKAYYSTSDGRGSQRIDPNPCRVTWDRGNNPTDCSTWKQYAGPNGGACPKSIQIKTRLHCGGID
ncbi:hypothetical protein WAI453_013343 [Rhynchosporium graminicola]|uniref:Uncharacterized protein n=1 Tax=Rhynchosporium graminicola TaxID=2792576 RepID=A0A1E1K9G0_9HELO|nr:uncharacterized protein RCO7_06632 [Rhynchosporium commune]